MQTRRTVCSRDCYDTCALIAYLDEQGQLKKVIGDPSSPITRGFVCPRGAKDAQRVYTGRVLHPQVRTAPEPGREFRQVDWEEALKTVTGKLKSTLLQHGPGSVLLLDYAGNIGLKSTFSHRLWNALGVTRTDGALCSVSGQTGLAIHYGSSHGLQPEEVLEKDLIVFWGFNAPVSAPHIWYLAMQARKQRGAKIVVIDPRRSEAAKDADIWLRPRPGGDTAIVGGIINFLVNNDHMDRYFLNNETVGYDEMKEISLKWTPQRVEKESGVSPEQVESVAQLYAKNLDSATMIGIGLQKTHNGADLVRTISYIPTVLGHHRGFFYSNGKAYYVDERYLSGASRCPSTAKTVSQVDLGHILCEEDFRFVFIYNMNPLLTVPNQQALRKAFRRRSMFVVVHDTHWTRTADYADVVLPAATFFEKSDIVVPWTHRYARKSSAVIPPLGESREEVWLMQQLARGLGLEKEAPWLFEDPWKALEKAFEGAILEGSFDELMDGKMITLRAKPPERYNTLSGKIQFEPLPRHLPLRPGPGEFVLLHSAVRNYTSTQFTEVYGPIPPEVTVNPVDAQRLRIGEGDVIVLSNELGRIRLRARLSDDVPTGVLWCPRQLEDLDGISMNVLTSGQPQSIGGGPTFNSTLVRINFK